MSEIIKHGRDDIWDLEIDSYKDVFLRDFFEDTVIDFVALHCEEMYVSLHGLQRQGDSKWKISIPINNFVNTNALETACQEISSHCSFLIGYSISNNKYADHEITVQIENDMSIYDAFHYAISKRDDVINYASSLENKKLASIMRPHIEKRLPVYSRAMKKVELELSNFITDDISNNRKIVDISSRTKTIDSIQEKIYRKNICQFDIFDHFDDIAGVRCTCEFISDVYDVLEYIKKNPLLNVQSIEDKIVDPLPTGYRGIHVIATTDIYYHGSVYENIKVEIQLRTAFQNAWSMKTHQLTYKRESGISDEVNSAMRLMSDALHEADSAAQKIKDELRSV